MTARDMRSHSKSDNAHLDGKLKLRRHFLDTYHAAGQPRVLDCCQATGLLWTQLRQEYKVKYLGVDRVPEKGRLAIDSVRMLGTPNLPYDVIDVDTYGSPWRHYKTLLPNLTRPTTVFLTLGWGNGGGMSSVDGIVMQMVGLGRASRLPPKALQWRLDRFAVDACLSMSYLYGVRIIEAREVVPSSKNARYFGLHLNPTARAP